MQKQFPEIEEFFRKHVFSEDELNQLKDAVEHKYKDNQVRKAASSLIALHLVKFQMKTSGDNASPAKTRSKPRIKAKQNSESKSLKGLNRNWEKVKEMDISQIANRFGIPLPMLLNGLETLSLEPIAEKRLNFEEFEKLYGFIKESINELRIKNRQLKKEKKATKKNKNGYPKKYRKAGTGTIPNKKIGIKTSKKPSYKSAGVFDKIHREGGLGKIIYTRM